ncbi:amidohydrolase family protein [Rhodococcus sp. NPDC059968]|uniref:amidohydrolase family protein n=1 Tax=Rhodococcus sp. NPDC059968 TaxID=3347017 RepID=UPI00366AE971
MSDVVIRGGLVVSLDPNRPDVFDGDVHYSTDGQILAVGKDLPSPESSTELDATGMIVMPGLIDSHRHPWQSLLRGMSTDQTVVQYRSAMRASYGSRYAPEDVYAATLLADLEALNSGVTTVADLAHIMNSPEHADAAIQAHHDSGQRVLFAHGAPNDGDAAAWWSHSSRTHPDDIRRIRTDVLNHDDALVTLGMFMRPPFLVDPDVLAHDLELARELDIHVSVDGGVGGGCWGSPRWGDRGLTPVKDIADLGQLGPHITLVHCNNLPPQELKLIADSGANISISPDHEMNCGHGLPATKNVLKFGIEPGLSIDSVIAVSGDMFAAMRSVLTSTRGIWADRAYENGEAIASWDITSHDVLRFATVRSAAACGMGGRIGSLVPGARADILLLKSDPFNLSLLNNPVATIVTTAHPGNVDTVIVDGKTVKRGGQMAYRGVDDVIGAAERARSRIIDDAGDTSASRIDEWSVFS